MDSMSSGHSSGSGSGTGNADVIMGRRRVTVKPLDEPDDDEIPTYMRSAIHTSPFSIYVVYCVVEPSCARFSGDISKVASLFFVARRCTNVSE